MRVERFARSVSARTLDLILAAAATSWLAGCGGRLLAERESATLDASDEGAAPEGVHPAEASDGGFVDGSDAIRDVSQGNAVHEPAEAACEGPQCAGETTPLPASRPCNPTDARGTGGSGFSSPMCNVVLGWAWDGTKCIAILGCSCEGSGCGDLFPVQSVCRAAFAHCP